MIAAGSDSLLFQFFVGALRQLEDGPTTVADILDRALDIAARTGDHYEDACQFRQGEPLDLYDLELLKTATARALEFAEPRRAPAGVTVGGGQ